MSGHLIYTDDLTRPPSLSKSPLGQAAAGSPKATSRSTVLRSAMVSTAFSRGPNPTSRPWAYLSRSALQSSQVGWDRRVGRERNRSLHWRGRRRTSPVLSRSSGKGDRGLRANGTVADFVEHSSENPLQLFVEPRRVTLERCRFQGVITGSFALVYYLGAVGVDAPHHLDRVFDSRRGPD